MVVDTRLDDARTRPIIGRSPFTGKEIRLRALQANSTLAFRLSILAAAVASTSYTRVLWMDGGWVALKKAAYMGLNLVALTAR